MEKKPFTKNSGQTRFEHSKVRNKIIVDQYQSLNIGNRINKQQQIICQYCHQQIPQRLMQSHKKICIEIQKNQYYQSKQYPIKNKLKKIHSMQNNNKLNQQKNKINIKNINKKDELSINNKFKQSKKKINLSRDKKNQSRLSQCNINKFNINNIGNSLKFQSKNYINNRNNSKIKKKDIKINKQQKKQSKYINNNYNIQQNKSNIKKITQKRNHRNLTQQTKNLNQSSNYNNRNNQRINNSGRRQTINPSRQTRNRRRVYQDISSQQSFFQEHQRGSNHNTLNFISQALNQQFSMMNSQFTMMNQIFANFTNFIPNIYDQHCQYYIHSPINTMFYHSNDNDQQYQQNNSDAGNQGLDEQTLQSIPRRRYHFRNHNQQQCTVCLSDLKDQQYVKNLSCTHVFHSDCIDQWLRRKAVCPVCRQRV